MKARVNPDPEVSRYMFDDDGQFPNSGLFLLIYKKAFIHVASPHDIEKTFAANNWKNPWRNGIYDYHHYHSITHEVLGVYDGSASIQFGGPKGITLTIEKGDVIVIPAGLTHKYIEGDKDFKCVGAYPDGKDYDIMKGNSSERFEAEENINNVPLPENDPVYGLDGPLILNWEIQ